MFPFICLRHNRQSKNTPVLLTVGTDEWAFSQVADYIQRYYPIDSRFRIMRWRARLLPPVFMGIIHFFSRYRLLHNPWPKPFGLGRASVLTWFHGDPGISNSKYGILGHQLARYLPRLTYITTSCSLTANKLLRWGVPKSKLVLVPLGVDTQLFRPPTPEERHSARNALGVSDRTLCIASFQKDGVGWGAGLEPKMEKGPDILVKVVERIADTQPVNMLLSGPSRGYVIKCLEKRGIKYIHVNARLHSDLVSLYHAADIYLITSREEGGPLSLLESLSCGVPVVSTKAGMAPDIIQHGISGSLADVDNVDQIACLAIDVARSEERGRAFGLNGRNAVLRYDWNIVVKLMIDQVYAKCP